MPARIAPSALLAGGAKVEIQSNGSIHMMASNGQPVETHEDRFRITHGPFEMVGLSGVEPSVAGEGRFWYDGATNRWVFSENGGVATRAFGSTTLTHSDITDWNLAVDARITNVINGAPSALDQLNEIAAAIGNDPSYSTTVNNLLAGKFPLAGGTLTGAGGAGFHGFLAQSVAPGAPADGFRLFANAAGKFTLIRPDGFTRTFDFGVITGNRIVSFPDADITVFGASGAVTANRHARITATGIIGNALLSDDGTNTTLTSGQFLTPNGSQSLPAFSFSSDPDTGMFSNGVANQINWSVGSVRQLVLNGSSLQTISVPIQVPDGTAAAPTFSFSNFTGKGFYSDGANSVGVAVGGAQVASFATSGRFYLLHDGATINLGLSSDTVLTRDAANTLALRNSTNAQTFRVYNTYTDVNNYERASLFWSGSIFRLALESAGTGLARGLFIDAATFSFRTNGGTTRWSIDSSGHLVAGADNAYDLGANGATRPRTGYFGTSVEVASGGFRGASDGARVDSAAYLTWLSRSRLASPADSIITLFNNAQTDFNRLQFGGTTASFPALKRSATTLQVRLADDSGYAPLDASVYKVAGTAGANGTFTTTDGKTVTVSGGIVTSIV